MHSYLGLGSAGRMEALLSTAPVWPSGTSGPLLSVVSHPSGLDSSPASPTMSALYQEENRLFALPVQMEYMVYPAACADAVTRDQHVALHLHGW